LAVNKVFESNSQNQYKFNKPNERVAFATPALYSLSSNVIALESLTGQAADR
jgi:hypothetical protein